jgi:hypothetical protein
VISDDFMTLFGEWGVGADGELLPCTVRPFRGRGRSGPVYAEPENFPGLPRLTGSRLVRNSEGNETVSSATLYAPLELREVFTLHSQVDLGDGIERTVLVVSTPSSRELGGHVAVNLE